MFSGWTKAIESHQNEKSKQKMIEIKLALAVYGRRNLIQRKELKFYPVPGLNIVFALQELEGTEMEGGLVFYN